MKSILYTLILVFAYQTTWSAVKMVAPSTEGHMEFVAVGRPAMLRIKGESTGPTGDIEIDGQKVKGQFKLPLAALSTGIDMRDRHMKEKYLEVEKYPDATLTIDELTYSAAASKDVAFKGNLNLHGVTKSIAGKLSVDEAKPNKKAHAEFEIKLSDFGISIPSYAGITIADNVVIKIDSLLKDK